jgi:hypothetical protein
MCINDRGEEIRTLISRFNERIRGSGQTFSDDTYKTALANDDLHRFKEKVVELHTAAVASSSVAASSLLARSDAKLIQHFMLEIPALMVVALTVIVAVATIMDVGAIIAANLSAPLAAILAAVAYLRY